MLPFGLPLPLPELPPRTDFFGLLAAFQSPSPFLREKKKCEFVNCKLVNSWHYVVNLPRDFLIDGRCISNFFLKLSKSWNNLNSFHLHIGKKNMIGNNFLDMIHQRFTGHQSYVLTVLFLNTQLYIFEWNIKNCQKLK